MPELKPFYAAPDARDLIIEAALAAFAEHGFHGATMRDIAARAGVSQSLVHHHFGAKDALWNMVGERILADFMAYVAEATGVPEVNADSVPKALRIYLRYWKEHPAAFRVNLWRILEGPKGERETRSKAITSRTVPLFAAAQAKGHIRSDIAPGMAMIILGSLVQFWLHSQTEIKDALAASGDEMPGEDAFVEIVLDLVRARPARGSSEA